MADLRVRLKPDDAAALRRLASALGVSAAGWVRIAIRDAVRGRPGTRKVYPESVADWAAREREAKESEDE